LNIFVTFLDLNSLPVVNKNLIKDLSMQKERFETLFEPCRQQLKRFAYSIAANSAQAEDIIADTIYYSYQNFEDLKSDKAFLSYLFTIARRVKNQLKVNESKFARDIEPDDLISNDLSPEEQYDVKLLHNAVAKLKDKEKEAIILFSFSGLSIKEIAKIQNTTTYNVKIRIFRAKISLKKILSISGEKL
jgi:RNA polymerase sigma-70 factor (ECF subfamily)